jgi:quercetin dioxygenase-like cupin family protein
MCCYRCVRGARLNGSVVLHTQIEPPRLHRTPHERERNKSRSTGHQLHRRWLPHGEPWNVRIHRATGLERSSPHSHSDNEECVYVLAGTLRYSIGSETRDLSAGQTMSTPRGIVHAFSNPFAETARALIVLSPDIGAQYFRDVAAVANTGEPPDRLALQSVMARYGLVPAAPK